MIVVYEEGEKTACPECVKNGKDTSGDNFHWYGEGLGGHCFSCGYTIPSDEHLGNSDKKVKGDKSLIKESDLKKLREKSFTPEKLLEFHSKTVDSINTKYKYRGLDTSVCKDLGVRWTVNDVGKPTAMHFPAKVKDESGEEVITGYKSRDFPKTFYSSGYVGKCSGFFGQTKSVAETLIIVAGEIDLITAISALENSDKYRKNYNVVSNPTGEDGTDIMIKLHYDWVDAHKKIIICMDNDEAGEAAFQKIQAVVSNSKLFKANLRHNDLNEYLKNGDGDKIAGDIFWNPVAVKDWGIAGSNEIWEETKKAASVEGIELPPFMSGLKKVFPAGIPLGEIVNLASNTSTGKTVIVNELTLDWVMRTKHKMLIVSFEDNLGTYGLKIASRVSGININRIVNIKERLAVLDRYKADIFKYLYADDGSPRFNFMKKIPPTAEELKQAVLQAVKVNDSKIILFDPLSSILHKLSNEEQTSWMLFEEDLKRDYGITCINSLHTRKTQGGTKGQSEGAEAGEEDIKGSATIIGTGTINILIRRNRMAVCPIEQNTTIFKVTKNRPYGITMDYACRIYYSPEHHTLFDFDFAEQHNFFKGYTLEQVKGLADNGQGIMVVAESDDDGDIELLTEF